MTPKDGDINKIRLALIKAGYFPHPHTRKRLELTGETASEYEDILEVCKGVTNKPVKLSRSIHRNEQRTVLEFKLTQP